MAPRALRAVRGFWSSSASQAAAKRCAAIKAAYREEFALWKRTVKDTVEHRGGLHMAIDAPKRDPDAMGRILRQRLLPVRS